MSFHWLIRVLWRRARVAFLSPLFYRRFSIVAFLSSLFYRRFSIAAFHRRLSIAASVPVTAHGPNKLRRAIHRYARMVDAPFRCRRPYHIALHSHRKAPNSEVYPLQRNRFTVFASPWEMGPCLSPRRNRLNDSGNTRRTSYKR